MKMIIFGKYMAFYYLKMTRLAICVLALPQFQLKHPHSDDKLK